MNLNHIPWGFLGVFAENLPQGTGRRAVEAAVCLVDERPHLHRPLQRAVVVGILDGYVAGAGGEVVRLTELRSEPVCLGH